VGDIMSFMQGPTQTVDCAACLTKVNCPSGHRGCAFSSMWNRVNRAIFQVYDETTIQDLLDNDRHLQGKRRQSPTRASQTKQGHRL
jgi:DNA-binding IscR family transcriptional regulator